MDIRIRQFIKIIIATAVFFFSIFLVLLSVYFYIPTHFYRYIFSILTFFFLIGGVFFIITSIFLLTLYKKGNVYFFSPNMLLKILRGIYPFILAMVNLFHYDKNVINQFFIQINNIFVDSMRLKGTPMDILILVPHCIQNSNCNIKITSNLLACKECGKCAVSDLKHLHERYGCKIAIATGGTLARKAVVLYNPKYIIAIACERDLMSGILDVNNIPVYGILNIRPNGPCVNTTVNIQKVKDAITKYIEVTNKE